MIGWKFPSNNHGREDGFHDAGIETFKGSPLDSLAREIIQNSCDARLDADIPVKVVFELYDLQATRLPGMPDFSKVFQACAEYWKKNAKVQSYCQAAQNLLSAPKVPILKISDYNTTGLRGSTEGNEGEWHKLIKSIGDSTKESQSGGSFGIGKHAPFACSNLRTIFYGTRDKDGKTAFQGVAKLMTHLDTTGEPTQGTGYFGLTERNKPILDFNKIDEFFYRQDVGTDVFIAGFHAESGWESEIIKSVLENFFVAIYESRLIVTVSHTTIDSTSLPELLEMHVNGKKKLFSSKYYQALTSPQKQLFLKNNLGGLGEAELHILTGKDFPRKIAMVRNTGMKIFDKDRLQTPLQYAGVMIAKGRELNEFLRSIEPPTHTKWEPERHEDRKKAKSILDELDKWIKESIRSLSQDDSTEDIDVEGMSQYLPDDIEEEPLGGDDHSLDNDGLKIGSKKVEINARKIIPTAFAAHAEIAATRGNSVDGAGPAEIDGKFEGVQRKDNKSQKNDKRKKTNKDPDTKEKKPVQDMGNPPSKPKLRSLKNPRIFCTDPEKGTYYVSFVPDSDGEGFLTVYISGEDGRESAPLKSAFLKNSNEEVYVGENGYLGPISFIGGQKTTLLVELQDSLRCALEVTLHASKL